MGLGWTVREDVLLGIWGECETYSMRFSGLPLLGTRRGRSKLLLRPSSDDARVRAVSAWAARAAREWAEPEGARGLTMVAQLGGGWNFC